MTHTATSSRHSASALGPLASVLEQSARQNRVGTALGVLSALVVHGMVVLVSAAGVAEAATPLPEELLVEIDTTPPEPELKPEPQPEPEPRPEEVPPQDPEPIVQEPNEAAPEATEDSPPPAAAEVGQVLTAEPDADAPLDLTGNTFVSGDSTRFAGGVSARGGTSKKAVHQRNARPGGVAGETGKKDQLSKPRARRDRDRSRPAIPLSTNWSCGFPAEADQAQIDYARVRLVVVVGPDGKATSVAIQQDPGHGFGALARACAFRYQYRPGLSSSGEATTLATPPFWVTFTR